jgi:hypothetical protein
MLRSRPDGLDRLHQSRLATDNCNCSPLRRRYSRSPSLPFFLLSSTYALFITLLLQVYLLLSQIRAKYRLSASPTHHHRLPLPMVISSSTPATPLNLAPYRNFVSYWIGCASFLTFTRFLLLAHHAALVNEQERNSVNLAGLTHLYDERLELHTRGTCSAVLERLNMEISLSSICATMPWNNGRASHKGSMSSPRMAHQKRILTTTDTGVKRCSRRCGRRGRRS